MKQKQELPVGVKVRGYGLLNEYGEFDFIPEQKGVNAGRVKILHSQPEYTISTTKKKLIVHISVDRGLRQIETLRRYLIVNDLVFLKLQEYDI